jgi:hypothetical protein
MRILWKDTGRGTFWQALLLENYLTHREWTVMQQTALPRCYMSDYARPHPNQVLEKLLHAIIAHWRSG